VRLPALDPKAFVKTAAEWHSIIAEESHLPPGVAQELQEIGFVVMPGPVIPGGCERYSQAYDRAVTEAPPADVSIRSSTRVSDLVNKGPEFDGIYIFGPLLAACSLIIDKPFKLSGMRARTLEPGAPTEALHVDVQYAAHDWPLVGFILMIDAFTRQNGATRFVPGSHLQPRNPSESMENPKGTHEREVLALGPAGSLIIFNASLWHSHTANRSEKRRRSIQGHFVAREAQATTEHATRMRIATLQRIGDLGRYVLDVARAAPPARRVPSLSTKRPASGRNDEGAFLSLDQRRRNVAPFHSLDGICSRDACIENGRDDVTLRRSRFRVDRLVSHDMYGCLSGLADQPDSSALVLRHRTGLCFAPNLHVGRLRLGRGNERAFSWSVRKAVTDVRSCI
jgi:hypothetical protein